MPSSFFPSIATFLAERSIGDHASSITVLYLVAAAISILLLFASLALHNKEILFVPLFAAVSVVNVGYCMLSAARSLEYALIANRIAYLGSVFLPMFMLLIILKVTHLRKVKWLPWLLAAIAVPVFLIAGSPGYSTIYYSEVTLQIKDGFSYLEKVYGPWHSMYLYYLVGYFAVMVAAIIHAIRKNALESTTHAVILASTVLINLVVWFVEQLIDLDFEVLSVSYVVSCLGLLGVHFIMTENKKLMAQLKARPEPTVVYVPVEHPDDTPPPPSEQLLYFEAGLTQLTKTERAFYDAYLSGKGTKEIMEEMNITMNTVKFHNKNLYGKLGVTSRKQLLHTAKCVDAIHKSKQAPQS